MHTIHLLTTFKCLKGSPPMLLTIILSVFKLSPTQLSRTGKIQELYNAIQSENCDCKEVFLFFNFLMIFQMK